MNLNTTFNWNPLLSQLTIPNIFNVHDPTTSALFNSVSKEAEFSGKRKLDEDSDEEKLKKRRSQIAAASRKSRAKRKQELVALRVENEALRLEIRNLKRNNKQEEKADVLPSFKCESQEEAVTQIQKRLSEELEKLTKEIVAGDREKFKMLESLRVVLSLNTFPQQ